MPAKNSTTRSGSDGVAIKGGDGECGGNATLSYRVRHSDTPPFLPLFPSTIATAPHQSSSSESSKLGSGITTVSSAENPRAARSAASIQPADVSRSPPPSSPRPLSASAAPLMPQSAPLALADASSAAPKGPRFSSVSGEVEGAALGLLEGAELGELDGEAIGWLEGAGEGEQAGAAV
mmetsp:Transcript_27460/g.92430  ORF Transcript_27460/g.92430 Transcript_27460/m.92430 type:complete len:178 (+) Transcript_27460:1515-2048(+)